RPIAHNEPGGGTEPRGADTQVRPYTGRAGRVLLVDDNADMRGYVRRVLSQRYEVEAVPDGQAALEVVARRKPDVVLADVMMPRMDGVDLLRALRGGPETRAIPVILLSARAGVESRVGGLNAGADDYLIKPFSARELVARVEIQIARSRLETGLEESEEQYRTLFESIDEGFCVIEMLFDDKDKPIDYRFLRVNPAFKRHTGFENAVGKTVREFVPDHDEHWFTVYGNVARTGEPARFESAAMAMHRWFDVYAFRTGQPESRRVAVLFKDITVQKRAEEERARLLREIETERERLADVFRQAPSFMCVLGGQDHVFERANELYYQLIGNRDLLGKPMREAVPEAATQGFVELLDEVYQTGEAFAGTAVRLMLQRQPSGPSEERFVDFVFQPLRDPDGSIAGIFVQGVDLTDRSRAEAALRENEERFQALLEHSYDAIVVIDSSGAITYASPSTFRVFGYTPQELLGKSAFDVIHPDDIPAAQAGLGEAAQLSGSAIWIELRIQHKNGSTVWIEVSGHNLLDQPQVHGIVSHFRDITERKVAEDAREAERQRLKTLVDSSPVGVFVIDAATDTILVANNEFDRVMGMTYEEGQAMQWPRFASAFRSSGGNPCAPEDLPFWRALREGAVIQAEEMHVRSQGNTLPVLVNASPVYSSDGRVSAVIGIVQDATPLQEAERQRSEFQAMVTHELRSPLAVIKSVVLVAKDEMSAGDTSEIEELLGSVDAQADRLLNMVNNLLDVSQMEAGAFTVFPQPTELPGVIEEAVATLRRTSQLTVDLRAPDRLPPLHIDRGRVTQVLENLLNNAAKFTQDGKPIAVDIEQSGTGVTVRVRNNGPVIPANQIPLLFKKFSQLQHHAPGAGLGLAICRGIVEAHGGRIWAESSEEIQETAFSFTLPVAVPVTTQQEIDGGPDSADGPAASGRESTSIGREGEVREVKRVLAVDDEPLLLQHLKRFLIKTGYHPILTGDPAEVLSLVEAEKPDLVLLDLRLPGISGFEVFEQIKTISAAPVIFLSANDRSEDKAIALRMGAEDYVTKPFSPVELEARMEAALRRNDGHDT
ncbi:MAG: PAS domain S-box protein, partial [Dehalococcoidia bacterium]